LEVIVKEKITEMLRRPEWSGHWDGTKNRAGEKVKEIIAENMDTILSAMLGNAVQEVVNGLLQNRQF
jgi:hypothetical protein